MSPLAHLMVSNKNKAAVAIIIIILTDSSSGVRATKDARKPGVPLLGQERVVAGDGLKRSVQRRRRVEVPRIKHRESRAPDDCHATDLTVHSGPWRRKGTPVQAVG